MSPRDPPVSVCLEVQACFMLTDVVGGVRGVGGSSDRSDSLNSRERERDGYPSVKLGNLERLHQV